MATAKILTLKVSERLAAAVDAAARRRGMTRSRLVREALEAHLRGSVAAGSVLDRTSDLAGCLKGLPRDLSSNRTHLKGFGR